MKIAGGFHEKYSIGSDARRATRPRSKRARPPTSTRTWPWLARQAVRGVRGEAGAPRAQPHQQHCNAPSGRRVLPQQRRRPHPPCSGHAAPDYLEQTRDRGGRPPTIYAVQWIGTSTCISSLQLFEQTVTSFVELFHVQLSASTQHSLHSSIHQAVCVACSLCAWPSTPRSIAARQGLLHHHHHHHHHRPTPLSISSTRFT